MHAPDRRSATCHDPAGRSGPRPTPAATGVLTPRLAWCSVVALVSGCEEGRHPQSMLEPAGVAAGVVADLWWVLLSGAAVIWCVVIGTSVYAVYVRPRAHDRARTTLLIIGGGAVAPTLVLLALLVHSLRLMPTVYPAIPDHGLRISVSGERWWWRIAYEGPGGTAIALANEIGLLTLVALATS